MEKITSFFKDIFIQSCFPTGTRKGQKNEAHAHWKTRGPCFMNNKRNSDERNCNWKDNPDCKKLQKHVRGFSSIKNPRRKAISTSKNALLTFVYIGETKKLSILPVKL